MRVRVGGVVLSISLSLLVAYASSAAGQEGSRRYPTDLKLYTIPEAMDKSSHPQIPSYDPHYPGNPRAHFPERESEDETWGQWLFEKWIDCGGMNPGIAEEIDRCMRGIGGEASRDIDNELRNLELKIRAMENLFGRGQPPASASPAGETQGGLPSHPPTGAPASEQPFVVPTVIIPNTLIEY